MNIVSLLVLVADVYFSKNPVGLQKRRFIELKVSQYIRATFYTQIIDAPVQSRDFSRTKRLETPVKQTTIK